MVTRGSVLVVDDEVNLCRILGAKLAKSGYSVVAVHDGVQAVEKVRESDFDVVLLDLILPKMDGLSALAQIRSMRDSLPVIVMTACESAEALETARRYGVIAYVNKPFDLDSLVTLVQDTSRRGDACHTKRLSETSVLFARNQPVTLEIQNGSGVKTYPSSVYDKDESTLSVLTPCCEGIVLEVPPRTCVRIGLAAQDAHYSFTSRVLRACAAPAHLLVLDKPGVIYRAQRRMHTRYPIRVPISYRAQKVSGSAGAKPQLGETRDLSLGGMSMAVPERVSPGEILKVEIRPKTAKDVVSVVAQVLRSTPNDVPGEAGHVLGCRFLQADETLRRLIES